MDAINDYGVLCDRILASCRGPSVIAVEGFTSSGKSRLANDLASNLGGNAFHTDAYLAGNDPSVPYPRRVDQAKLGSAIKRAESNDSIILVEGICLRQTLQGSAIHPSLYIHVKRIATKNYLWNDGINLEEFEAGGASGSGVTGHELSDLTYHVQVFHMNSPKSFMSASRPNPSLNTDVPHAWRRARRGPPVSLFR